MSSSRGIMRSPSSAIMIMVVVVPVVLGAPAASIFIPPAVIVAPAKLAGFAQFNAGTLGLRTVPAMAGGRMMEVLVGADDAALTGMFIGEGTRA